MRKFQGSLVRILIGVAILAILPLSIFAQGNPTPVAPVPNPCTPRFPAGGIVHQPPALFSQNGVLNVQFSYQQTTDAEGRLLHCFMTPSGIQNPTLHVNPGDTLNITVTNNTPASPLGEVFNPPNCGDDQIEFTPPASGITSVGSSLNIHYHGTNTTPQCGGDNVVKTLINSGSTFQYSVLFPTNEPPGLYWYHPHVHGLAERDLLGGATGALVVDGIQNVQPAVSGLRHRILVIRDQPQIQGLPESAGNCGNGVPFQDLSVNFVPINSNSAVDSNGNPIGPVTFTPAVLHMEPGETQFWRVANTDADSILDLQVLYDGVPQTMQIVGEDAVPVNSQDGTQPGSLINVTDYRLAVAGRVEFLIQAPSSSVKVAQFVTNNINTGPQGDCDPTRPIFNIKLVGAPDNDEPTVDNYVGTYTQLNTSQQLFGGTNGLRVTANRVFQFSEIQPSEFFITQVSAGQTPTLFDTNNPPAVVTTQGAVEQWTIQNIAQENHEFHMHQIHFKVLAQNNYELNGNPHNAAMNGQFADMIEVPFWDNVKNPKQSNAPAAVLLMDFRGMDIGSFVYHCHILSHEDLGMMAIIQVNPSNSKAEPIKDNKTPVLADKKSNQPSTTKPQTQHPVVTGGGGMD